MTIGIPLFTGYMSGCLNGNLSGTGLCVCHHRRSPQLNEYTSMYTVCSSLHKTQILLIDVFFVLFFLSKYEICLTQKLQPLHWSGALSSVAKNCQFWNQQLCSLAILTCQSTFVQTINVSVINILWVRPWGTDPCVLPEVWCIRVHCIVGHPLQWYQWNLLCTKVFIVCLCFLVSLSSSFSVCKHEMLLSSLFLLWADCTQSQLNGST